MKKAIGFLFFWLVLLTVVVFSSLNRTEGGADGLEYDNYMGPVMPMTVLWSGEGLSATRDVVYDFASYEELNPAIPRIHTDVTDTYTLTNTTDEDMTVETVYPFKAKLQDWDVLIPAITVNGEAVETKLTVGGDLRNGGLMDSGEKLIAALDDGSYMEDAFAELFAEIAVMDESCVVYRIDDLEYDGKVGGEVTLAFSFVTDVEKNRVLMYNVPSFRYETETNRFTVHMNRLDALYTGAMYVIFPDEDIDDYTLRGYSTRSCEEGTEVDGFTAQVTRTESVLSEWMAAEVDWAKLQKQYNDGLKQCIAYGLTEREMQRYAWEQIQTEHVINPIADGSIVELGEFMYDSLYADRMMYLRFPVTVPAGESVTVAAESVKYASASHMGGKDEQEGYDLMTALGSNLVFAEQTVSTVNTEGAELVENNFGFDWEQGITEVTLDPAVQHYWMKVKKSR